MFSALAARIAERRRGLPSGSPPPVLAATVISLIRRVNILPRLASSAPFLCLIVAHLEWPDMRDLSADNSTLAHSTDLPGASNPNEYSTDLGSKAQTSEPKGLRVRSRKILPLG